MDLHLHQLKRSRRRLKLAVKENQHEKLVGMEKYHIEAEKLLEVKKDRLKHIGTVSYALFGINFIVFVHNHFS